MCWAAPPGHVQQRVGATGPPTWPAMQVDRYGGAQTVSGTQVYLDVYLQSS